MLRSVELGGISIERLNRRDKVLYNGRYGLWKGVGRAFSYIEKVRVGIAGICQHLDSFWDMGYRWALGL